MPFPDQHPFPIDYKLTFFNVWCHHLLNYAWQQGKASDEVLEGRLQIMVGVMFFGEYHPSQKYLTE